jgi:hypothetical protein
MKTTNHDPTMATILRDTIDVCARVRVACSHGAAGVLNAEATAALNALSERLEARAYAALTALQSPPAATAAEPSAKPAKR